MGYLLGYEYEGGYRVWIPRIGVRECRDVTIYEGTASVQPDDGSTMEVGRVQALNPLRPSPGPPTTQATSHVPTPSTTINNCTADATPPPPPPPERLTIRVPGRFHPRARRPALAPIDDPVDDPANHIPTDLAGDPNGDAPQYVGQTHDVPPRSTRSGLVRRAGGALLAFKGF